jgi:hypothetical protein
MMSKLHIFFREIDKLFNLEKGTAKEQIKKHLKIESVTELDHEQMSYLLRYCDNILLLNNIDIDEAKKV